MEELIKYLEERIKDYDHRIEVSNLTSYDELMQCHKLACKVEAYQEIINYIDNIKNK